MLLRATLLWVVGLLTIVPYATYFLLYEAQRDQYALLITLVLFWIFGYWGVVGPILAAVKARRVFKTIETAHAQGRLKEALRSKETADVAIDIIASENRIPRFIAAAIYRRLVQRFKAAAGAPDNPHDG
jgi:hypothetical protein